MKPPAVKINIRDSAKPKHPEITAAGTLLFLGALLVLLAWFYPTGSGGIENIGKLHRQSNAIHLGVGMAILGGLLRSQPRP